MSKLSELRRKAQQCSALAEATANERVRRLLLSLVEEFTQAADRLETEADDNSHGRQTGC